jgi:hypothetical protein
MSDTNVHRVVGNLLVGSSHFFVDTVNNRVGVNTSSPSASLDIATGDLKVGSGITLGNSGTITAANFSGNGSGLTQVNSDQGSWVNGASSNIHLAVSTDKVGIGTVDPGSDKLRIDVGNITADTVILNTRAQYASSNLGYLQIKEVNHTPSSTDWNGWSTRIQKVVDTTQQGYIEFNPAGDPYGIAFGNDGGSASAGEVMRIDGINKRLGIGNNNPDGPLHVTFPGNSNFTGITYQSTDVKTVLGNTGNDNTNTSFIQVYSSVTNSVPDANSSTYKLALQPFGGSVGIGTHSPGHVLDIQGSQAFDGSTTVRILNPAANHGRTQLHLVGRYEASNDGWSAGGARNAIMFKSQSSQNSGITNQWTIQSFPNGNNNDLGFLAGGDDTPKVMFRGSTGDVSLSGIIKQTGANWALTNGGVSEQYQYLGAYAGDYAYLNRTLSTPTNVTLTHENQGGNYTRSRITINTAGKYAMYINGFRQVYTSGTKQLQLHKNGSYVNVRAYSGPATNNEYSTAGSAYTIMNLSANDYVEVKISEGNFHGNDSIYFAGHLIA